MKKLKIILICISMSISSLIIPIFGNWYKEKTGIEPIVFYFVSGCVGFGFLFYVIFNIIDNFTNTKK